MGTAKDRHMTIIALPSAKHLRERAIKALDHVYGSVTVKNPALMQAIKRAKANRRMGMTATDAINEASTWCGVRRDEVFATILRMNGADYCAKEQTGE